MAFVADRCEGPEHNRGATGMRILRFLLSIQEGLYATFYTIHHTFFIWKRYLNVVQVGVTPTSKILHVRELS